MDILKKFTIQNLKLNKKRTIVTIIGIILSTSLICGVMGLVASFQQSLINMVKDNTGYYHTRFYDVPKAELKYIEKNANVESTFLTSQKGTAYLDGCQNKYKPYLSVFEYDQRALKNNGIKLITGRLPENSNELLISEHIKSNGRVNYKVGDTITINVGDRVNEAGTELTLDDSFSDEVKEQIINSQARTYKIVGVMERPDYSIEDFSAPGYTVITTMSEVAEKATASVVYKDPSKYRESNKVINGEKDEEKYETLVNSELLRYEGIVSNGAMQAIVGIATVVMIIIVCSSVFVIRNSFSISVSEKNRQYGMLASIGATKKQIRRSVLLEGLIIGLIAIPLGIICGIIGIVILLQVVNYLLGDSLQGLKFVYRLPLIPMLIAVAISGLTIYLSCLLPSIKASRISPIDSIRGNNDIKMKSRKLKAPRYIKKVFGIGGVIASKNLKRCRRKYITTVISIVISIVIFVSLSSFIYYGNRVSGVYYVEMGYNTVVNSSDNNVETYKKISKMNNIDNYAYYYEGSAEIDIEKYYSDFGKEMIKTMGEQWENNPSIAIVVCNNDYFKKYIKDLGINESEYDKAAILSDDVYENTEDGKRILQRICNVNDGETMEVEINGRNDKSVKIYKRTAMRPLGFEGSYSYTGTIYVAEDYLNSFDNYTLDRLYIKASNPAQFENTINDLVNTDESYSDVTITNIEKFADMENRMVLVISIFLYGFITVITLIGVTNIFNTITTNMILRSKEFAMLKSIGMTTKEFNHMIRLESILYGVRALIIGLPLGILGSYFIYQSFSENTDLGYVLPIKAMLISIVFVFIIVGATMKYSLNKINKQNIIETIRNDNI